MYQLKRKSDTNSPFLSAFFLPLGSSELTRYCVVNDLELQIKHLIEADAHFMDHLRTTHLYLKSNGIDSTMQWVVEQPLETMLFACQSTCIFFERLNAWTQLIQTVENTIEYYPNHPSLTLILTYSFVQIGQYEEALTHLESYLAFFDQSQGLWSTAQQLNQEIEKYLQIEDESSTHEIFESWRGPTLLNQVSVDLPFDTFDDTSAHTAPLKDDDLPVFLL